MRATMSAGPARRRAVDADGPCDAVTEVVVSSVTAFSRVIASFQRVRNAMNEYPPRAGTRIIVSTVDGSEEDDVLRVLERSSSRGLWLVETAHHGRVVVLKGRNGGRPPVR